MLTEVQREKVKLFATFMNNAGIAVFGIAGVAPAIAIVNNKDIGSTAASIAIAVFIAIGATIAILAHGSAARQLELLADEGTPEADLKYPQRKG